MSLMLENKQGLIAGDGFLPVELAKNAKENGYAISHFNINNCFIYILGRTKLVIIV